MKRIFAIAVSAVLVVIDQVLKLWALADLAPQGQITVIPNFFWLTYVENRGAAFGIFQDKTSILSLISLFVLIVAFGAIVSGKIKNQFLFWSVTLVLAGGAGNCIDRIGRGFVVDYLDFSSIFGFPVFNFADCCVVIGTILILLYVIIFDRKEDGKNPPIAQPKHEEI